MKIKIIPINETYIQILCDEDHMEYDISDYYTFKVPNVEFDPRFKNKNWDGKIRLFNRKTKRLYKGLLFNLLELCNTRGYKVDLDRSLFEINKIDSTQIEDIIEDIIKPMSEGVRIKPFDYQLKAVLYALTSNRALLLAATSAGKSLIIYLLSRIYQLLDETDGHILIIVPNISLVEQLYSDFEDYANKTDYNIASHVQKICGKYSKFMNKKIVISTWQSLSKMNYINFTKEGTNYISACIVDEVHSVRGQVLSEIIESLVDTKIRIGLTGSLDTNENNIIQAQGLIGNIKKIISAKELIDDGKASKLTIRPIVINYSQNDREKLYNIKKEYVIEKQYNKELEYIYSHEKRNNFLINSILSTKGNKIVLFDRVEEYGLKLYEKTKLIHENTFLIYGNVDADERESIRLSMKDYDDAIIFASYQTSSTGVSIKKLHSAWLISSTKSKIRILQSIGRLMRLHESKNGKADIYDVVDCLEYKGKKNYIMKHFEDRLTHYVSEQHLIKFVAINLSN